MMGRFKMAACCAALIAIASTASADNATPYDGSREVSAPPANWVFGTCTGDPFADNFDSYQTGNLCTQSTWEEWADSVDVCGIITTDQAFSSPNSLNIIGTPPGNTGFGDDTVHRFLPLINGGVWTFSIMTYVPTGMSGSGWIILLNQYPTANWSLQVRLEGDVGNVVADFDGENIPIIFDEWIEFRAEIDLAANPQGGGLPALGEVDYYYDNVQFVFDKEWSDIGANPGPGTSTIAAVDLYGGDVGTPGGGPTTGVFYDDVRLVGNPGCGCGFAAADMNCDGLVDATDIEPFICLLFDPNCVPCSSCAGDINGDGTVNAEDIEPFINILFP